MATLTNTQISVTYVGLLKTSASTVLSSTAQQITDGSGNNSVLFLSTAGVGIGGAPSSGIEFEVTGNAKITGDLIVDNLTIDGSTIASSSTNDITIDSGGDIILDSEGADVLLKDGGTHYGSITNSSTDLVITSIVADKDIIFKGLDDSSNITALTLDMSDAGKALFNSGATFGGSITSNSGIVIDNITIDGSEIDLSSGDLTLDVAGDIILDAGGGDINLKDDGTDFGAFTNSSGNLIIKSGTTTMLTGSGADATFDGKITGQDDGSVQLELKRTSSGTDGNTSIKFVQPLGDGYFGVNASGDLSFGTAANLITNNQFKVTRSGNATFAGNIDSSGVVKIEGSENTLLRLISTDANVFLELRDNSSTNGNFIGTIGNTMPFYTNNTLALTLDASQNATFAGTIATSGNITVTASNATISATESGGATTKIMGASVGRVGTSSNHNLEILSNDTAAITIDTSQNIGIGVSPVAKLHVSGDTGGTDSIARFQNTNSAKVTRLQLSDSAGTVGDVLIAYDHSDASSANHFVGMGVNNNTAFKIDNNDDATFAGNVAIGTGTAASVRTFIKGKDDSSSNFQILTRNSSDENIFAVNNAGDVLFGSTSRTNTHAYFEKFANDRMILSLGSSSTSSMELVTFRDSTNGAIGNVTSNAGGVSFNSISDYRLKENIVEMTGALDRVSQLKPSQYNLKNHKDNTVEGFIAHELQEVYPQAVSGEKDKVNDKGEPEYQFVDNSKLVPLLVCAIQELKKEIEILKNK